MKHPGTFNANPLSAAAGIATLKIIAQGEANRKANEAGWLLRQKLNQLFSDRGVDWVCYGEFSRWNILTGYDGPRPTSDDFVPYGYGGEPARIEAGMPRPLVHQFRCAMLLNGVDPMGPRGLTMASHTAEELDRTVTAIARTLDLIAD
jgi:glutamate-1-semialdehyde 2,1-aminomutase